MTQNPALPNRRSVRLKGYDYSLPGAYFITLVSHRRAYLFGHIENCQMHPSPLGKIIAEEWTRTNTLRREVQLYSDEWVLMPNHLHGIVWLVPTETAPEVVADKPKPSQSARSLSSFVAGFKSVVTRRARYELGLQTIWQRGYYDHIIRTSDAFNDLWEYIDANPERWHTDLFNAKSGPSGIKKGIPGQN